MVYRSGSSWHGFTDYCVYEATDCEEPLEDQHMGVQKRKQLEATKKERLDRFMAGFSSVSVKLKEMYQMITLGGDAELELVDSLDPFAEVRPND